MDLLTYDVISEAEARKKQDSMRRNKIPANPFGALPYSAPMFAEGGPLSAMAEKQEETPLLAYGGSLNSVKPEGLMGNKETLFALGGVMQSHNGSSSYIVGKVYDVTEAEAERLKKMGYEFRIIG